MVTVAKMDGQLVQILKIMETVPFSTNSGWVMICLDFEQPERKKQHFKWVPISTRFEWVRTFAF